MRLKRGVRFRRMLAPERDRFAATSIVAPIAAVMFAMACASQPTIVVWEKPGATPADAEAARQACLGELEAPDNPGVNRSRLEADATGACFVRCMRERGFTWRTEKAGASGPDQPGGAAGGGAEAGTQEPAPSFESTTSGCSTVGVGGDGS